MCTEQVPRWQHWGLHLKGLCTPSPWYLAEACKPESHGSSRQEKGCDKGQRSAPRHQASGWSVSTGINATAGLLEESLSQQRQGGTKARGSKQARERFGPLLQYLGKTTPCTRSKNMVLSALEYWPPPQSC